MSRTIHIIYLAITLIGAVFVLTYRGPFWPYVRSYMGDFLVVQFIYLVARFWISPRWRYYLAGAVFLLGVLVEVIQFFGTDLIPRSFAAEITIGSTFDPLDIAAYALGLVIILVVENLLSGPKELSETEFK